MASATEKKLELVLPAIQSKVASLGNVAERKALESLYGRAIIALAVAKGHFKSVTVLRQKPGARHEKFSVICNELWDRQAKPHWMQ